ARWVVGSVDHNRLSMRTERRFELGAIDREIGRVERDVARRRAGDYHVGAVVLVKGLEDDHLVAGIYHRQHARDHGLGRAAGDGDVAIGVAFDSVVGADLVGDRAAQIGRPMRDRVLVVILVDRALGSLFQLDRRRKIGKSLGQIDGASTERPARHLPDYGLGEEPGLVRNLGRHRRKSTRRSRYGQNARKAGCWRSAARPRLKERIAYSESPTGELDSQGDRAG